mgnify:CR=1 FL=1
MKRRLAREIAVSSLYQMEMTGVAGDDAVDMVMEEARQENEIGADLRELSGAVEEYARELVRGVAAMRDELDRQISGYLTGWQLDRLSRVDRQILRVAAYEMNILGVPPKVVVNEAIEVAKHFGMEESGKFVNGVLGRMIREKQSLQGEGDS